MPHRLAGVAELLRSPPHENEASGGDGGVRVQGDRSVERFDGFLVALQAEQRIAHAGVGHRELGVDGEHRPVRFDGPGVVTLLAERLRHVLQRRGVAGRDLQRAAQVLVGLVEALLGDAQPGQLHQRRGVVRMDPRCPQEAPLRFVEPSDCLQRAAGQYVE